jgi:hypothetical protein
MAARFTLELLDPTTVAAIAIVAFSVVALTFW